MSNAASRDGSGSRWQDNFGLPPKLEMLLVRPRPPERGTSFTAIRTLTLPSVAAAFSPWARVTLVEESSQPIPDGHFDLVGISCETILSRRAYQLARRFRAQGLPVIMGGTHPTAVAKEALAHCDAVVVGEVEELAGSIVADLRAGRLKPRYQARRPPELSHLPPPDVEGLPAYSQHFRPYPIELTRGCRHACRFCFNRTIHGRGFRRRDLDRLVQTIARRPERRLVCMDDNLMNDPEHLAAFARKVAPLRRSWGGQSTLSIADDRELLRLLRSSGFSFTFVGLESFCRESLRIERKVFNDVARYALQFARLREHGILPFAGVIVGLDGDGPDTFERTAEALERIAPAACAFTMPVAFPGTSFYREMEAQGRIVERNLDLYDGHHVVIRPARMTVAELEQGYHRLADSFFGLGASARRLMRYPLGRMNMTSIDVLLSYAAITLGYRLYHDQLASRSTGLAFAISALRRLARSRKTSST